MVFTAATAFSAGSRDIGFTFAWNLRMTGSCSATTAPCRFAMEYPCAFNQPTACVLRTACCAPMGVLLRFDLYLPRLPVLYIFREHKARAFYDTVRNVLAPTKQALLKLPTILDLDRNFGFFPIQHHQVFGMLPSLPRVQTTAWLAVF